MLPLGNLATSWEVLLVSSGYRRGILFHILQGTEQPPKQRTVWPQVLLMPRLSNPDPGKDFLGRGALSERSLGRSEE